MNTINTRKKIQHLESEIDKVFLEKNKLKKIEHNTLHTTFLNQTSIYLLEEYNVEELYKTSPPPYEFFYDSKIFSFPNLSYNSMLTSQIVALNEIGPRTLGFSSHEPLTGCFFNAIWNTNKKELHFSAQIGQSYNEVFLRFYLILETSFRGI